MRPGPEPDEAVLPVLEEPFRFEVTECRGGETTVGPVQRRVRNLPAWTVYPRGDQTGQFHEADLSALFFETVENETLAC